jgi:hypothetical protein
MESTKPPDIAQAALREEEVSQPGWSTVEEHVKTYDEVVKDYAHDLDTLLIFVSTITSR